MAGPAAPSELVKARAGGAVGAGLRQGRVKLGPMDPRPPSANARIAALIKDRYRAQDVAELRRVLDELGTLAFTRLDSGLFAASPSDVPMSGYHNVWVRDNVHVAYAHQISGELAVAVGVAQTLLVYFHRHRRRLQDVVVGIADPAQPTNRPHIRFDGQTLQELPDEEWPHAQNDALGYFVWLVSSLARQRALRLSPEEAQTLLLFVRYFQAIRFWQDADSGHWEETPKLSASSIGTVMAGLRELAALLHEAGADSALAGVRARGLPAIEEMLAQGQQALNAILPAESIDPALRRPYDAALLFLIHPLRVVTGEVAATVLGHVDQHLTGPIGIRRYPGDSYWAPDYDLRLPAEQRTQEVTGGLAARDRLLERPGDEAQWCIFDGYLSAHHGAAFAETRDAASYQRQVRHANRVLRQISSQDSELPNRCPELYYLKQGQWIPNAHTPLQWSQASLAVALEALAASAKLLG